MAGKYCVAVAVCLRAALLLGFMVLCRQAAAVYYADVPDVPITEDGVLLRFVGGEVLLSRGTVMYPDRDVTITYAGAIYGDAGVAVTGKDSIDPIPLSTGEPVGPGLQWIRINSRLVTVTCPKQPPGECTSQGTWSGGTHYLGLRFHDETGTYYGWARLGHAGASAPVILYAFAIETTPNLILLAGSKETLPYQVLRCLRFAAGLETPTPDDIAVLDRSGTPGRIDIGDATVLARLLAPPERS